MESSGHKMSASSLVYSVIKLDVTNIPFSLPCSCMGRVNHRCSRASHV